ncbi:uncharacterized protein LOC62_05G007095 [Vanrija pseudolonga]|uniref:Uncharacterized protein n=1 Tax=Vanrija pseudolonga TaxID=143232 RepID=A0AAF1BK57_9TREE|nr:hypothetical protein LOC62_05G007095 [Vanrija pseudolonga]
MSLDSSAFPHILYRIVDMVKAANDYPTLVNLRATCKSLDDELTPLVMGHATLKTTATGYTIKTVHGAPGITSPWPPFEGTGSIFYLREAEVDGLLDFIDNATVLDLETPVTFQADIVFDLYLPTIKVLRHKASSHIVGPRKRYPLAAQPNSIMADKEVFFVNLTRQSDFESNWIYFETSDTTKEVVLSVTYEPSLDFRLPFSADDRAVYPELHRAQEHLVVIFQTASNASSHRYPPRGDQEYAALEAVLDFIAYAATTTRKITIVGIDQVDWRLVGIQHVRLGDDLVAEVRNRLHRHVEGTQIELGNGKASQYAARSASLLKFVTLDEYKQQVGEYEFKISTEE